MASAKQIAANRRNAQKSCGPKSAESKAKVSQNGIKHGLCGRFTVLSCEDQAEYDDLFERFVQAEKPVDDVERELVAKMARHTWLSDRAMRCQEACFLVLPQSPEQEAARKDGVAIRNDIELHMRYQTHHDRAYQRASAELQKRKEKRRLAEIGFAREKRAEAQEERRETRHVQRQEQHFFRVATAKNRLERDASRTSVATAAVSTQFDLFESPENGPGSLRSAA
jgi:hypothetical protein